MKDGYKSEVFSKTGMLKFIQSFNCTAVGAVAHRVGRHRISGDTCERQVYAPEGEQAARVENGLMVTYEEADIRT